MVLVVNPSGRAKTNPKIQVLVLRMSILHTLQPSWSLAMANSGPNTNGSQFYINQNKEDISSKLPTDRPS